MTGNITEAGFILSDREMVYLAAMAGAEELYGVQGESFGADDGIASEWERVREQLERKSYIDMGFNNTITVDPELYALIAACAEPKVFIRAVRLENEGCMHVRNFYITHDIAAELDRDRTNISRWYLTPLVNIAKVISNLSECYYPENTYKNEDGIDFETTNEIFETIRDLPSGDRCEAVGILTARGCPERAAEDFVETLEHPLFCASLFVMFLGKGGKKITSHNYYGGTGRLWAVTAHDKGPDENSSGENSSGENRSGENSSDGNAGHRIRIRTVDDAAVSEEMEKLADRLDDIYHSAVKREMGGDKEHG